MRLLRRGEQRDSGLAPAQGHLEILVRLHHLPRRLVARALELLLRDPPLRSRHPEAVAAQAAVEDRHLDRDRRAVGGLVYARPARRAFGAHTADVQSEVAGHDDARIELRFGLRDVGLTGAKRRHVRHQVRALRERPIDELLRGVLHRRRQCPAREARHGNRSRRPHAHGFKERHARVRRGGQRFLQLVRRACALLARLQHFRQRRQSAPAARLGRVLQLLRQRQGRAGHFHTPLHRVDRVVRARDVEDDSLVRGVEAEVGGGKPLPCGVERGLLAAEIEQQPLQS